MTELSTSSRNRKNMIPKTEIDVLLLVMIRNYQTGKHWLPGVICTKTGPVSLVVKLTDGRERRCHKDQIRKRSVTMDTSPEPEIEITSGLNEPFTEVSLSPEITTAEPQ